MAFGFDIDPALATAPAAPPSSSAPPPPPPKGDSIPIRSAPATDKSAPPTKAPPKGGGFDIDEDMAASLATPPPGGAQGSGSTDLSNEGWGSYLTRLAEKAGEGLSFGLLPHAIAGVRSIAGTPYQQGLQEARHYTEQTSEQYPIASMLAEGAGMLAPTAATFGAVNPVEAAALRAAPSLVRPLVRPAVQGAVGAVTGAADAAGHDIGMGTTDHMGSDIAQGALLSGGIGAAVPALGAVARGGMNSVIGHGVDAETQRLAGIAQQNNIPIFASQLSDSPILKQAQTVTQSIPFSGMRGALQEQHGAWQQALTRLMGVPNAEKVTATTLQDAYNNVTPIFRQVAQRNNITFDPAMQAELQNIWNNAGLVGLDQGQVNAVRAQIDKIRNIASTNGNTIPGTTYFDMTKRGETLNLMQQNRSSTVGQLADQIRTALDDGLSRATAGTPDAGLLQDARSTYRLIKTIEPLTMRADVVGGLSPSVGDIKPSDLLSVVQREYGTSPTIRDPRGQALKDLAQIGQRFLKEYQTSHTGEISHMFGWLGGGALLGHGVPTLGTLGSTGAIGAASVGVGRGASHLLRSEWLANRMQNPSTYTPGLVAKSVPQALAGEAETSSNPSDGLPEYSLKANQQVAHRMLDGSFSDHAATEAWVNKNKAELRQAMGGQGIQRLHQVAALLRRAQAEAGGVPTTALSALANGRPPEAIHSALRSAGVVTPHDLLNFVVKSPGLTKELAQRVSSSGRLSPIAQRRLLAEIRMAGSVA